MQKDAAVAVEVRAAQARLKAPRPEDHGSWSPPKRRPLQHLLMNTPSPEDRRGAKRASKKPKSSRARRR